MLSNSCAAAWTGEDLYQEGITKALECAHLFHGGNFLGWMNVLFYTRACGIINTARKELKDGRLTLPNSIRYEEGISGGSVTNSFQERAYMDHEPLADDILDKEEQYQALYKAILELPEKEGLVILFALENELTGNDSAYTAEAIGTNLNNLKQYKWRAYNKLRKKLRYLTHHLS